MGPEGSFGFQPSIMSGSMGYDYEMRLLGCSLRELRLGLSGEYSIEMSASFCHPSSDDSLMANC